MSILNGHATSALCYTNRMKENDENGFPPIPPPPSMTVEQHERADASIRAAIAREAERHRCHRAAMLFAPGDEEAMICGSACFGSALPAESGKKASISPPRLRKAAVSSIRLPENKPRKPNLHAANLSFAASIIICVRDRYANNAPAIYKAAYLSRKTYSAIISDENHVVSKRTAVQLAFALRLTHEEADLLLHAAGYHLSRSVVEDMIFDACLDAKIYNLEDVNSLLREYECRPFVPQK